MIYGLDPTYFFLGIQWKPGKKKINRIQETRDALDLPDAKSPTNRFWNSTGSSLGWPRSLAAKTSGGSNGVSRGCLHGLSCDDDGSQAWERAQGRRYSGICGGRLFFESPTCPPMGVSANKASHGSPNSICFFS